MSFSDWTKMHKQTQQQRQQGGQTLSFSDWTKMRKQTQQQRQQGDDPSVAASRDSSLYQREPLTEQRSGAEKALTNRYADWLAEKGQNTGTGNAEQVPVARSKYEKWLDEKEQNGGTQGISQVPVVLSKEELLSKRKNELLSLNSNLTANASTEEIAASDRRREELLREIKQLEKETGLTLGRRVVNAGKSVGAGLIAAIPALVETAQQAVVNQAYNAGNEEATPEYKRELGKLNSLKEQFWIAKRYGSVSTSGYDSLEELQKAVDAQQALVDGMKKKPLTWKVEISLEKTPWWKILKNGIMRPTV